MVESLFRPSSPQTISPLASASSVPVDFNTPLLRIKPKGAVISILGADLKQDIRKHLDGGTLSGTMEDHLARPLIVGAQADVETAALNLDKAHHKAIYIMHTEQPATPLRKIELDKIHPLIRAHEESMKTVSVREETIKNLLEKNHVEVYNIFPKAGYQALSENERANFDANVEKYPSLHAVQISGSLKDFGAPVGAILLARHNDDAEDNAVMMLDASQVTQQTNQWAFNFSDTQTMSEKSQQMLDSRMPLLEAQNIPFKNYI